MFMEIHNSLWTLPSSLHQVMNLVPPNSLPLGSEFGSAELASLGSVFGSAELAAARF